MKEDIISKHPNATIEYCVPGSRGTVKNTKNKQIRQFVDYLMCTTNI